MKASAPTVDSHTSLCVHSHPTIKERKGSLGCLTVIAMHVTVTVVTLCETLLVFRQPVNVLNSLAHLWLSERHESHIVGVVVQRDLQTSNSCQLWWYS